MKKFYLLYFDNNKPAELLGEFNTYEEAAEMDRKLETENPAKYAGHICMPYERTVEE